MIIQGTVKILCSLNIIIGAPPHSPTHTSLHLRHSSFSNPSAALPTSQLILQLFRCFTYVIDTSPTSHLILQPFRRFTYATAHSKILPPHHLRQRHFTWRAAHAQGDEKTVCGGLACYSKLLSLEVATVVKNFTTSSKLIFLQSFSVL